MMKLNKSAFAASARNLATGAGALVATGLAMADPVDTTAITGAGASVALVGAAVFTVYVGVKLFKWIRSAL